MLTLIATPIGRTDEITLRSIELFKGADVVICESTKETSTLLKKLELKALKYEVLNEHSSADDVLTLASLCENLNVVLVSDCGTPSFCDPGFQLVKECRKRGIKVQSSLGASSLMGLLSLSSERIEQFLFRGFLPAETTAREQAWLDLKKTSQCFVLMDTPYRLKKMLEECSKHISDRKILLVLNLSQENEQVLEGKIDSIKKNVAHEKAEFMLLVYGK